jgi:retinol dehydrogenase-14
MITGATRGIGRAAALELAELKADLLVVGRNVQKGRLLAAECTERGASGVEVLTGDLSSMTEVRRIAGEAESIRPHIHVLLNNAGALFWKRQVSADGFEMTFALNHLAPFLLTQLLLPKLEASAPSRVVVVSSDAAKGAWIDFDDLNAERSYRGMRAYGQSKLANILFTQELARRLAGRGVTANCCHPGWVATGFNRNNGVVMRVGMVLSSPFARTARKGAETPVYLAASPDVANESGGFYFNCRKQDPPKAIYDPVVASQLWRVSAEMVGLPALTA